jgi:hypothetical protein
MDPLAVEGWASLAGFCNCNVYCQLARARGNQTRGGCMIDAPPREWLGDEVVRV